MWPHEGEPREISKLRGNVKIHKRMVRLIKTDLSLISSFLVGFHRLARHFPRFQKPRKMPLRQILANKDPHQSVKLLGQAPNQGIKSQKKNISISVRSQILNQKLQPTPTDIL